MADLNHVKVTKTCPNCGVAHRLTIRTNRATQEQFLGCPNWPECKHTEPLPEDVRLRAAGQQGLFE